MSRGLAPQPRQLIRMVEQREHAVAEQVRRRLVAGDEKQDQVGEQLVVVELRILALRGDHAVEHRVLRLRTAARHRGARPRSRNTRACSRGCVSQGSACRR